MLLTPILLLSGAAAAFVHPGALHTADDIARVKYHVTAGDEPWSTAFELLTQNGRSHSTWKPSAHEYIIRGSGYAENYGSAYNDAAAAYQLALRWLITGDDTFANASVRILNAYSSTLKGLQGSTDLYLAAGLYGYQFANAAELMRSYSGWNISSQHDFGTMLTDIFASVSLSFLEKHNGNPTSKFHGHYYANWDLCNIANLMAVGIFTDNQTMYDYATEYFLTGAGNGALPNFAVANFTEEGTGKTLTQGQEAGRDQGHATLDFALLGVIAQQGFNQGNDLFATYESMILNAQYNVNQTVPYTAYDSFEGVQYNVSAKSRGNIRPGFELLVAHYEDVQGLNASWSAAYRDYVNQNTELRVEGGGGNYGPNSGGFDALGYGTLMYRRNRDEE
ncbi:chondroitin AC/alginate lyase [Aureobasidium pullulans]|nr:chondroitin AC/alginate lyase [Aureobasidium pullulans]